MKIVLPSNIMIYSTLRLQLHLYTKYNIAIIIIGFLLKIVRNVYVIYERIKIVFFILIHYLVQSNIYTSKIFIMRVNE